ncbi:uncharacterized protein KQ657_002508 [Scheffersomyces spartinae]|uniref:Adenylyl cyclase-associated protein n=1 Tax=Scheffersomyces spartinae TaxID=45513 RepID=A0A9P7V682_9ASCO|nr:uncharacterized protein KQ657_002508 [Scheffersomyces spartinae]KAG7192143.1 hypothetical protein KQ657_002508 [Scheffersomyces spartinae]
MASDESQINLHGYNVVTILKRLEAATSRLEDITVFQEARTAEQESNGGASSSSNKSITEQPSTADSIMKDTSIPVSPSIVAEESSSRQVKAEPEVESKVIAKFKEFQKEFIVPFVESSEAIDPVVKQAASTFAEAFDEQLRFLKTALKAKKPELTDPDFAKIVGPISQKIAAVSEIKDANRSSKFFNHLNTISEGAPALGWIVNDTPVSFIPEFKDSAQFWSNRILKEFKDKDPDQVEWVKKFLQIFEGLKTYVKEFHTTGPSWNAQGKSLSDVLKELTSTSTAASVASGGAPPPPPPPPPPSNIFEEDEGKSSGEGGAGMGAVFADLNQGVDITRGLKKVDKSEMTHKNPELRGKAGPLPPKKPASLSKKPSTKSKPLNTNPPRKELVDGKTWFVENYSQSDGPIVIELEMSQSVFIGRSSNVTVQLKGKGNSITVSGTDKVAVIVDSLISGIDVIKSNKFGIQIVGSVPIINVDKSDEGTIYLSNDSINAHIYSSSTTALNINVPVADDDYLELAVPEQFMHVIKDGKLVSEVVEHLG